MVAWETLKGAAPLEVTVIDSETVLLSETSPKESVAGLTLTAGKLYAPDEIWLVRVLSTAMARIDVELGTATGAMYFLEEADGVLPSTV